MNTWSLDSYDNGTELGLRRQSSTAPWLSQQDFSFLLVACFKVTQIYVCPLVKDIEA